MPCDTSMIRLLMEIGFLAAGRGLAGAAETIFRGIQAIRPESEYPVIGMAMARINNGDFTSASQLLLKEGAVENPDRDLVKTFLGMSLTLSGMRQEGQAILNEILRNNRDAVAVTIAENLLKNR